jgi:hypothetical protein
VIEYISPVDSREQHQGNVGVERLFEQVVGPVIWVQYRIMSYE